MIRRLHRYLAAVECDVEGCTERFTTGSLLRFARRQARDARWGRINWSSDMNLVVARAGQRRFDVCPVHRGGGLR